MKIIAVGRNYVDHIQELKNQFPTEPVIFSKPETALIKDNQAVYYPDFTSDLHHEIEIVVKISKMGKNIEEKFAHKYYDELGLGVDFTARDVQSNLKAKSLPWELAKAFDGSAPVSAFFSKLEFGSDVQNIDFRLDVNGQTRQTGNTGLMIYKIDYLISFISKYFTLKSGDLIFTGTPAGVAAVQKGDQLQGFLADKCVLDFSIL